MGKNPTLKIILEVTEDQYEALVKKQVEKIDINYLCNQVSQSVLMPNRPVRLLYAQDVKDLLGDLGGGLVGAFIDQIPAIDDNVQDILAEMESGNAGN